MNLSYSLPLAAITALGLISGCQQRAVQAAADAPVRIRWARDPETLDPMQQANPAAIEALNLLAPALLANDPELKKTVPYLVEAMPTSSSRGDSLTLLTFTLRPEAKWDNGQPVLAQDVALTLKLIFCSKAPTENARMTLDFIRGIELDAAQPRRFTLVCRGHGEALANAAGDYSILPEWALDPKGQLRAFSLAQLRSPSAAAKAVLDQVGERYVAADLNKHPEHVPGCGPYRLSRWESGKQVVFTRKANWWGGSLVNPPLVLQAKARELRYLILPDDASATLALRRGDIDVYPNLPARTQHQLEQNAAATAQLRFYNQLSYDVMTAGFNTSRPGLADSGTRQAISYLFDAPQLCQASQMGLGKLTSGLFTPENQADYNDSIPLIPYSAATAVARLQQAGWQRTAAGWQRKGVGEPLHIRLRYRVGDPTNELVGLQFSQAARSIGIAVEILPTESSLLSESLRGGDFDMYVLILKGSPLRSDLTPLLTKQGIGVSNLTRFVGTPATEKLLTALAVAETPAAHIRLVRKVQVMMREQLPILPLFFVATRIAATKQVSGLHVTSLKPGYLASTIEHVVASPVVAQISGINKNLN